MKTKFVLALLASAFFSSAFAAVTDKQPQPIVQNTKELETYPYVSLGLGPAPLLLPIFSAGFRGQNGHNGFDASVNVTTFYYLATAVKGSVLYHYYFRPNPVSQFYAGAGSAVLFGSAYHHRYKIAGAAEFTFGKQYKTDAGKIRYFQADIDFPIIIEKSPYVIPIPIILFKYGIGF